MPQLRCSEKYLLKTNQQEFLATINRLHLSDESDNKFYIKQKSAITRMSHSQDTTLGTTRMSHSLEYSHPCKMVSHRQAMNVRVTIVV